MLSSVVAGSEGTQRVFAYSVAATGGLVENLVSQGVGFRAARPEVCPSVSRLSVSCCLPRSKGIPMAALTHNLRQEHIGGRGSRSAQ